MDTESSDAVEPAVPMPSETNDDGMTPIASSLPVADPLEPDPLRTPVAAWPRTKAETGFLFVAILIGGQVVLALTMGAWTMPHAIPFQLLLSIPVFPAGLCLPLGLPTSAALPLGWLVYISLIVLGIRLRQWRWFRGLVAGFALLVLLNVAGCHWAFRNNPSLRNFSKAQTSPAGRHA